MAQKRELYSFSNLINYKLNCNKIKLRETPKALKIDLKIYFNYKINWAFISAHSFIKLYKLNSMEYQGLNESLTWLKIYLTGNNLQDNTMDNPQPSSYEDK